MGNSDAEDTHYVNSEFPPFKRKVKFGHYCNWCGDKKPISKVRPNGNPKSTLNWKGMPLCVCHDCDWDWETTGWKICSKYEKMSEDNLENEHKKFLKATDVG